MQMAWVSWRAIRIEFLPLLRFEGAEVGRLANLPDVLLEYRLHLQSTTFARRVEQNECLKAAYCKAVNRRGLELETTGKPRLARTYSPRKARREWIVAALKGNHPHTALKHARLLVRENRFHLLPWGLLLYCWIVCRRTGREVVVGKTDERH